MLRSFNWSGRGRIAAALVLCAAFLAGQSVTTTTLAIGGVDALGCAALASNPPTLEDGALVSGQNEVSYNSMTHVLTLTVSNTSPVVPGVPNPVITRVFANLPQLAVADVILLSQTGAGGPPPNFELSVDTDVTDSIHPIFASCFGNFGILLEGNEVLAGGGIKNPAADLLALPSALMTVGPVVFQHQIVPTSTSADSLIAQAFAYSLSVNTSGPQTASSVFKFQGALGVTGFVGNGPNEEGGSPAAWVVGEPMAGQNLTLIQGGTPTWNGWFIASLSPGPIVIGSHVIPLGPDYFIVFGGIMPPVGFLSQTVVVPQAPPLPEIGSITFFAITGLISPDQRIISVSEQIQIEIEF
jgi:hypothetical protein